MRSDIVGETKFPNCPDPAFKDADLESIIEVAEKLFLFGSRTTSDLRSAMQGALKSGFFMSTDDPPKYLPHPADGGFSRAFTDWVHSVVKARVFRRATGNPEEVMRRDLAVGEELENIAMRFITRNGGERGDPKTAFMGMEFVMRVQDKRHKLMGLDQTSLILTNDPAATVAGRVLNALLADQGASQKAWMFKQTVTPEALTTMEPEDQALALLRARENNDKPTDDQPANPDAGQGNVEDDASASPVEPAPQDQGLGVA